MLQGALHGTLHEEDINKSDDITWSTEMIRWLCSHEDLKPNATINTLSNKFCRRQVSKCPVERPIETRHTTICHFLLRHPRINPDIPDAQGRTPFSHTMSSQLSEIAYFLLETGLVNPNSKCRSGRTPLHYAILSNPTAESAVTWLLSLDIINPNCEDILGRTPLSYAAELGHLKIVQILLASKKVDVNRRDKQGRNPLFWAMLRCLVSPVSTAQLYITIALLRTGRINVDSRDVKGETPLTIARSGANAATSHFAKKFMESCVAVIERYARGESMGFKSMLAGQSRNGRIHIVFIYPVDHLELSSRDSSMDY